MKDKNTFIKLVRTADLNALVKEARRVKYLVERDDISVTVHDDEAPHALVFKAIQVQRGIWGTTFSKDYWQEPVRRQP